MVSTQLRAVRRMHSTSQKSIAYGSRFWGVMDSFPRRTAQIVPLVTARQNRREKTSLKCCMATAPPSLVRLPVQNVERCTPPFQSGAAAKREAGAIPDLHQNAVFTKRKVGGLSRKQVPPKGGQGTMGPLRRFFSSFLSAGGKKRGRRRQDKPSIRQGVCERKRGAMS